MICPKCECEDTRVIDTRDTEDRRSIRRRRQCVACSYRFTTYERAEEPELRVRKRDGRVEDFDRDKLEVGILKACEKRPIPRSEITRMIDEIEEEIRRSGVLEVESVRIGELVLEKLKKLDEVAYLRFASVYKAFRDGSHFAQELQSLRQEKL